MIEMEYLVELRQSVDKLCEEVQVLRNAIDELREVVVWISRNPVPTREQLNEVRQIFSMPLNATLPDVHERFNALDPTVATAGPVDQPSAASHDGERKGQRNLF